MKTTTQPIKTWFVSVLALGTFAGCAGRETRPAESATTDTPTVSGAYAAKAPAENVTVTREIKQACGIEDIPYAPRFAFDSHAPARPMEPALKPLAECLSKGALAGRKVRLIGRTDPRGSEEYNMVLGQARANAVSTFLSNLGVPSDRLLTTSRGELDAKGTAEGGWAHDRRVDIELAD